MKMRQKRQLLARNMETALQDCDLVVQDDEYAAIQSATVGSGRFGDLLTLSVLAMETPLRWFSNRETARKELPPELFVRVFSMAVTQEERFRSREEERPDENAAIIQAMQVYVDRARAARTMSRLESHMNRVWMAKSRADRMARGLGPEGEIPCRIIGYVAAARAVMPAVTLSTLLRDLLWRHGAELDKLAGEDRRVGEEFEEEMLVFLEELEDKGIRPFEPPGRQTRLF